MMVTERAHGDGFLLPHTPPNLRPTLETLQKKGRSISVIETLSVSNALENVPNPGPRLCTCGCELSDEPGTSSPIVGMGGASLQSNLQPSKTIFGAPAQVLYRGTAGFSCDNPLGTPTPHSRGHPSPASISPIYLSSVVQGCSHPSTKDLPQLLTRFCPSMPSVAYSMPDLMEVPGRTRDLDSTHSEGPGSRARKMRLPGTWSAKQLISQIKSKKLIKMSFQKKKEDSEPDGGSEGKISPDSSSGCCRGLDSLQPIIPRAAQCLQTQATCVEVSWSQAGTQESLPHRTPKGLFGRRHETSHAHSPAGKTAVSNHSQTETPPAEQGFQPNRVFTGSLEPLSPQHWVEVFAGEDRGQVVVTGGGLTFIGIYDGFMDCAAVDFLMAHLYPCIANEIEAVDLAPDAPCAHAGRDDPLHGRILEAVEKGYDRCKALFLDMVHLRSDEQPEFAVAGACVAVVVIKGQHMYTLNIGDSSAVLVEERKEGGVVGPSDACDEGRGLGVRKLTVDHNTNNEEEVLRVIREHQDDPTTVEKGRVKGKLRVTRAFGGVFMKEARMNTHLFSCFRIKYVGERPYLGSKAYLTHHPLSGVNGFLIVASDGLYQCMGHHELPGLVQPYVGKGGGVACQQLAQALLGEALKRAAHRSSVSAASLGEMQPGESRRNIHDDVTITILRLGN